MAVSLVPGYFPDMAIFPGFPGRKFPVISPAMRGLGASKYLIRQRYLQHDPAFCRTDPGFSREFSRETGNLLTRDQTKGAPGDTSSVPAGCRR